MMEYYLAGLLVLALVTFTGALLGAAHSRWDE